MSVDDDTVTEDDFANSPPAGERDHISDYAEQRSRQAGREQRGEHLRYAGHRDLHHLWCWGTRIDWMMEDHEHRSNMDGWCFRPTPECATAMVRLSYRHSHAVSELKGLLARVESEFSIWHASPSKKTEYDLNEILGYLSDRILANTDVMAEVEGVTPKPPKVESKIRRWNQDGEQELSELDAIIGEPESHDETDNEMAEPTTDAASNAAIAIEALLGAEAKSILEEARSDKSADERMRSICRIDLRLIHWQSPQWASLLSLKESITPGGVRLTDFWKVERRAAIEAERNLREDQSD